MGYVMKLVSASPEPDSLTLYCTLKAILTLCPHFAHRFQYVVNEQPLSKQEYSVMQYKKNMLTTASTDLSVQIRKYIASFRVKNTQGLCEVMMLWEKQCMAQFKINGLNFSDWDYVH